ncbi:hypothetical protein Theco_4113 (plasmid) [Thermobacillus composti KWC4]|uniref:Uncharacterized protein n=1 Tax=Thermobacillus composti (strain DSM 18247 / JCM 13945 / KWC4) TaxID=717605 RepID=L0EK89_THECK|nr:hypothetical protein Theco_4113 [Thermobacillus composti KWC4]
MKIMPGMEGDFISLHEEWANRRKWACIIV